ncbi:MAG: hypothetical protein GKR89_04865 [Candidatus Latescibacteria bacterium]|nr:hypothetical protein [Candidatus Latescibacterota bacterium]
MASYPLLQKGSRLARDFALNTESVMIIDHTGQVQYRSSRYWPLARLREEVENAVTAVPDPAPPLQSLVHSNTWGQVKADIP